MYLFFYIIYPDMFGFLKYHIQRIYNIMVRGVYRILYIYIYLFIYLL
jgi:hypothetical protein